MQPRQSRIQLVLNCYQYVIMILMRRRDPSLDTLLDLDGQVLVIDEGGYWVKFVVHQVPATQTSRKGSTTRSPCTAQTAGGWSGSTTLTQ